jgi:glycosyltransferase involved in cell wall biosynthesis
MKIVYANTIDYTFALQQRPHHIMNLLAERGHEVHWINSSKDHELRPFKYGSLTIWYNWENFLRRNPECDIYFASWSRRYEDLDRLKAKFVVYDSLDNFPDNEAHEEVMVSKSDLVLTTSQPLFDLRCKQHNNVHMCRNGCWSGFANKDLSKFPIKDVKGDFILFSGAIGNWVDVKLIDKLAEQFQVVVAGAYHGGDPLGNKVKIIGAKKYEELQMYYKTALVNILPFKRCQTSDYSNPIKMYEPAVFGVPTVSIDIPEAVIHQDSVYLASNYNEFVNQIQKAIKQRDDPIRKENLIKFAKESDWNLRVDLIEKEMKALPW